MKDATGAAAAPIRLRRYVRALAVCWTLAVAATLAWEIADEFSHVVDLAHSEARGAWEKEAAIRRWDAANGGVYVPITKATQPDPELANLPERDIVTPSGRILTLVNPAAIMRNIQDATRQEFGVIGHITSLRPLRASNAPDPWEKAALEAFEEGQAEVSSVEEIDGRRCVRLMRPLPVEESCLKCHAEQGYRVGDVRGGISVSVPVASVWNWEHAAVQHRLAGYGGMWLLGLGGIALLSSHLRRQIDRRYEVEHRLQEAHDLLEQRVAQRTAELAESNRHLESEIGERKQAERWVLESEQRFRGCFEQGFVGMAILSADQDWMEINERLCRMLGYAPSELEHTRWPEVPHPDDRPAAEENFQRMLRGVTKGFVSETRLLRKDGKTLHASLAMQCLRKEDGGIDSILVLVQDIAQRQSP
jgi:PAS domain S-box-containing protein